MYTCTSYGRRWQASTFKALVAKVDAYGKLHGLRAVSIVADWED